MRHSYFTDWLTIFIHNLETLLFQKNTQLSWNYDISFFDNVNRAVMLSGFSANGLHLVGQGCQSNWDHQDRTESVIMDLLWDLVNLSHKDTETVEVVNTGEEDKTAQGQILGGRKGTQGIFWADFGHSPGPSWVKENCKIPRKKPCMVTVIAQPPQWLHRFTRGHIKDIGHSYLFLYNTLSDNKCLIIGLDEL